MWRAGTELEDWRGWFVEPATYGFVACWMLMAFVLGAAWTRVLSVYLGLRLTMAEWLPIQASAWAGRYLPGKLGLMVGKLVLLERPGLGAKPLAFSVLFEQVAFVVTGGLLALILAPSFELLPIYGLEAVDTAWWRWSIALLVASIFFPVVHMAGPRLQVSARPTLWSATMLAGYYLFAHAVAGLGLYFILQATVAAPEPSLSYAIGLLAVANVAGIVAVFAPAGIGVRELVLVFGLSPFLSTEEALALSAVLRLLTIIADLAFSAVASGGRLLRVVRWRV